MLEKLGLVKLNEECGELIQISCKKQTRMDSDDHWDGQGSLKLRLENEIADVLGAMDVVIENFDLDMDYIETRAREKRKLFEKWMKESDAEVSDGN